MARELPTQPERKPGDVPSPVEATLRILQSSLPLLVGAAVVRHGGGGGVAAQIGRVPWVFDRRLTQLELSEDALPSNHAVLLDWPVPHQAEWVGAPPRLLIARLVASGTTVGVLLGTLVSREQLTPKTREAIELSCQLIASAVATERLARESEQQARRLHVLNELQRALSSSLDARALGRVLRDAMGAVLEHIGFSVSLFHPQRPEVAYRYRVVDADALSQESARRPLEDGPSCRAAQRAERVVFTREIEIALDGGRTMRRQVHVVQLPLLVGQSPIGIVTVQAFRPDGFNDDELELARSVVDTSANYFAHARRSGVRRPGPEEPQFTLVTGTGPVAPAETLHSEPPAPSQPSAQPEPRAEAQAGTVESASRAPSRTVEHILHELLIHVGALGSPHAFVVLADEAGTALRGNSISDWAFMKELDGAIGITTGSFVVPLDDRANAIARACREARLITVAWLFEAVQPALTWQEALALERSSGGGHCTIVPLLVAGRLHGAVVAGPSAQELSGSALTQLAARVEAAADELARQSGAAAVPGSEANALRLAALRGLGPTA